eukprot:RCo018458
MLPCTGASSRMVRIAAFVEMENLRVWVNMAAFFPIVLCLQYGVALIPLLLLVAAMINSLCVGIPVKQGAAIKALRTVDGALTLATLGANGYMFYCSTNMVRYSGIPVLVIAVMLLLVSNRGKSRNERQPLLRTLARLALYWGTFLMSWAYTDLFELLQPKTDLATAYSGGVPSFAWL